MISSTVTKRFVLATIVFVALAGCTFPHMLATSTTPVEGKAYQETGKTWGKACIKSILFVPFSFDASLQTALKNAREKVNADALINVVVDSEQLWALFYNHVCTTVHGTGIRFTGQKAPFLEPGPATPEVPKQPAGVSASEREEVSPTVVAAKAATESVVKTKKAPPTKKTPVVAKKKQPVKAEKKTSRKAKVAKAGKRAKARREAEKKRLAERKAAEREKKEKAEKERQLALAKRKAEEKARPVPEQFRIFCKYAKGDPVKVETKGAVIDGRFLKCVYFGVRLKKKDGQEGVIPFEEIWTVRKVVAPAKKDEKATEDTPAGPKSPARPKTPTKPAKPARP